MITLDQLSEDLAKAVDEKVISKILLDIAIAKIPEGYRLMKKGEYPNWKNGDLTYSINTDPKWTITTMTGTYPIREVPAREIPARKAIDLVGGLLWATKIN